MTIDSNPTDVCPVCENRPRYRRFTRCERCGSRTSPKPSWVLEEFDEWSELTKERDGYRADAEAERYRRY